MNTEPTYQGEKPPAGGQVIRCACGSLATHRARYLRDDGAVGTWADEPVCEACGRDRVVSPDPPRRIEPLPAWEQHEARVRKWRRQQERTVNTAAQQSWDI